MIETYVVHATFPTLSGQPFGNLIDGPADLDDVIAAMEDHFGGNDDLGPAVAAISNDRFDPTLANLRVYHILPEGTCRDETEDMILRFHEDVRPPLGGGICGDDEACDLAREEQDDASAIRFAAE